MTCIVGLVGADGRVWLGGDSAATNGWDLRVLASRKVARVGPLVFGATGQIRTIQVFQHYLTVPEHPAGEDVEAYVARRLVDAMREAHKAAGYTYKEKEQEEHAGTYLVGYRGRLFHIDATYGVVECADGYDAVGCGDSFARGALYASARSRMAPAGRVQLALEAAERFSAGVRGPFYLDVLPAYVAPKSDDTETLAAVVVVAAPAAADREE